METGLLRLAMNLRRHLTNASVERSGVSSRCNALEVAQVNNHSSLLRGAAGALYLHRAREVHFHMGECRASGGSGLYGTPSFFLQMTH